MCELCVCVQVCHACHAYSRGVPGDCTISASYEVSQAQKALLLMHHTARGASTSSEELNAQISPRTDEEHNLPYHEDYLQEH